MMDPVLQVITVVGTLAAFVCALIYFARWQDSRQRNYMNDIKAEIRESKNDVMMAIKELRKRVDHHGERLSYIEGKLDRAFPDGVTPPGAARPGVLDALVDAGCEVRGSGRTRPQEGRQ